MRTETLKFINASLNENNLINFEEKIIKVLEKIINFKSYNKILVCGNGGSAADSVHIVGELMKNFSKKRSLNKDFIDLYEKIFGEDDLLIKTEGTIRAISLTSELGLITAINNDIGGEYIFSQQVYGYADEGDILFAISTSGNSKSVINACKVAKAKGVTVVSFTGKSGGELLNYSDIIFNVPEVETYKVQQIHQIIYHLICLAIEIEVF